MGSRPSAYLAYAIEIGEDEQESLDARLEDQDLDWKEMAAAGLGVPYPSATFDEDAQAYAEYWTKKDAALSDIGVSIERDGYEYEGRMFVCAKLYETDWDDALPIAADALAVTPDDDARLARFMEAIGLALGERRASWVLFASYG